MSNSKKFMGKSRMYGVMRPWLGDGLLLSTGQKWHKRRKIITPAFHFGILKQFAEIFQQQSRILVSRLSSVCDGCAVDIYPFASKIALDVVCETAMGVQINAQTDSESEYVKAVEGSVMRAFHHQSRHAYSFSSCFGFCSVSRKQCLIGWQLSGFGMRSCFGYSAANASETSTSTCECCTVFPVLLF